MSGHYIKCPACDGSGSFTCIVCKGRKCRRCEPPFSGREICPVCMGSGFVWRDDKPQRIPIFMYTSSVFFMWLMLYYQTTQSQFSSST
jgi:hypothetical protein